jgi:hypothetical protein
MTFFTWYLRKVGEFMFFAILGAVLALTFYQLGAICFDLTQWLFR